MQVVVGGSLTRIPCFLVDYGIHGDCNLTCSYCRSSRDKHKNSQEQNTDKLGRYIEGLTNVSQCVNAVMFKTSGWGEITLLAGYTRLFRHARYLGFKVFQLITNGMCVFSESVLSELQRLGYFSLQMSIDGLNYSDNKYRFYSNPRLVERFFANVRLALSMGIPVEINTVLTDANTSSLHLLLDFLLYLRDKYNTPLICVPRRVKIKPQLNNQNQIPSGQMIDELEQTIIGRYSTYASVLPPETYLTSLIYNLRTGQRNWVCYDSLVRINIGASGDIVVHTTSGKKLLGSVLGSGYTQSFQARALHHSLSGDPDYQAKMNQFDIHYLYLGGKLSLSEISKIPSCSNPVSQNWLQHLRRLVLNGGTSARRY
jgi:MoaA/NifB/PqqE/SkfB family radical SAM enzyme